MNKINIPIKPTSIIVSRIGLLSELKYGLSIEANKITMAILMKLFEINIVASNLLGLSRSESILDINLLSFSSGMSDLSKEKKATSEPDVRADKIRNKKIKRYLTITEF
jgi:hypothetical protein|tara:strand:+ start:532 stop:858 length:327 start_codon:yes stop_codon:yes gene_type:complete